MTLALFDLDETLIRADSASLWIEYLRDIAWVDQGFQQQEQAMMENYASGKMSMQEYMQFTLQPLLPYDLSTITQQVKNFVEQRIKPIVYPQAQETLAHYRQAGARIIIISATAEFIVKEVAHLLGVQEVIAIRTASFNQRLTGQTVGTLSYQAGKVTRLKEYLGQEYEEAMKTAYFYSDSQNDLPLLNEVAFPHVVNPNDKLKAYALEKGWPVLEWK